MTRRRSVAAAQTVPVRADVDANLQEHARLARASAALGAEVVVFPELSLTGYELELAERLALDVDDERLVPLVDVSAATQTTLIVGAPVREDGRLHIGAFAIAPDGRVDVYTKHHLGAFPPDASRNGPVPPPEATVFAPGDRDPIVRLSVGAAALAVCADIGRASHPERAAARGARAYLVGMFVIPQDFQADTRTLRSYAVRHGMIVAMANFGGPTGGLPSAGGSSIWSPDGELLGRLPPRGSGVVVAGETDDGWRAQAVSLAAV